MRGYSVVSSFLLPLLYPMLRRGSLARLLRAPVLGTLVILLGGCFPGGEDSSATVLCGAPAELPGSTPFPPDLRQAVAQAEIPDLALTSGALPSGSTCNRLALESGRFAQQHALDAIDWRPWSADVLREAETLDRPLFVFVGFSACGECSRLASEQLADAELVREVNEHFVPVLVDRDERPDVDAYMMQAALLLTGGAGWPAVVFLQPDGEPFEARSWGAAAAENRKPLLRQVREIQRRIALGGGSIEERAQLTMEKMQGRAALDTMGPFPDANAVAIALLGYLSESFDAQAGSFGAPPLFPRAPLLGFLLQMHRRRANADALRMLTFSLDRLRESALVDPVDGGFHRFAAQANWQEPAYEKMLADNAALATVYLDAGQATGNQRWKDTARVLLEFMKRDLRRAGGSFAASLDAINVDADKKPCHGCFYAMSDAKRREVLSSPSALGEERKQRAQRSRPRRDETVFADANALAISAFVRGATVLGDPNDLHIAVEAADILDRRLRSGGRVKHCRYADESVCADGYLTDQTLVALAFLDLDRASAPGGTRWLDAARTIADEMAANFEHQGGGGFFLTATDAEPLPLRFKPSFDGAAASGNSAAALLYQRLALRTGDARYAMLARRTFEAFAGVLTLRPLALPSMASALLESSAPVQLDPAPAVQP